MTDLGDTQAEQLAPTYLRHIKARPAFIITRTLNGAIQRPQQIFKLLQHLRTHPVIGL